MTEGDLCKKVTECVGVCLYVLIYGCIQSVQYCGECFGKIGEFVSHVCDNAHGKNGFRGYTENKCFINTYGLCCGSNTKSNAVAGAGIAGAGIAGGYILYNENNTLKVNWVKIIKTFNILDWTQLNVQPNIPLEVFSELIKLYKTLINTLEKDIDEQKIWTIIKSLSIQKKPLKEISNKLFGEHNFFSEKIEQMYSKEDDFWNIGFAFISAINHRNTIKTKLEEKMKDENFTHEIKDTYNYLISFIKQNNPVQIKYPGLDGTDHTIQIATDNIYYIAPDKQKISFFDLLEDDDERKTFKENYKKVFVDRVHRFGVPEEQIMLRF
tara:strand:- start:375 stop:1346 length:972 start_codon:yes stop_codon:yes gene_type:complete